MSRMNKGVKVKKILNSKIVRVLSIVSILLLLIYVSTKKEKTSITLCDKWVTAFMQKDYTTLENITNTTDGYSLNSNIGDNLSTTINNCGIGALSDAVKGYRIESKKETDNGSISYYVALELNEVNETANLEDILKTSEYLELENQYEESAIDDITYKSKLNDLYAEQLNTMLHDYKGTTTVYITITEFGGNMLYTKDLVDVVSSESNIGELMRKYTEFVKKSISKKIY